MIKLLVKDFLGVKLKLGSKKNGDKYIDFTPIIKHANKLIQKQLRTLDKTECHEQSGDMWKAYLVPVSGRDIKLFKKNCR